MRRAGGSGFGQPRHKTGRVTKPVSRKDHRKSEGTRQRDRHASAGRHARGDDFEGTARRSRTAAGKIGQASAPGSKRQTYKDIEPTLKSRKLNPGPDAESDEETSEDGSDEGEKRDAQCDEDLDSRGRDSGNDTSTAPKGEGPTEERKGTV